MLLHAVFLEPTAILIPTVTLLFTYQSPPVRCCRCCCCCLCCQFPEKMIPKFTLLAARGADLPIHGDGMAVRRWAGGTAAAAGAE
jgi:hypothetical protein